MLLLDFLYPRFKRVTSTSSYLAEVDGLRFFAITMVLLFHIYGYFHDRFNPVIIAHGETFSLLNKIFINGDRGVQLFFVLSGFILCLPFARAFKENVARPDIKKYYWRRLTRLEPPYIIAMLLFFLGSVLMYPSNWKLWLSSLVASLVYMHGFIFNEASFINVVAWSLEVEVQFYLIAPLLFQVFRLAPFWRRLLLIVSSVVALWLTHFWFPGFITLVHQLPYFLVGMLLSDWYVHDQYAEFFHGKWTSILAALLFPLILYVPWKADFYALLLFPFSVFLFYYCVLKNDMVKKCFSMGWIPIIGGMCYSIYLMHYPVISLVGRFSVRLEMSDLYLVNLLVQFSILIVAIFIASAFFYVWIERPFMTVGLKKSVTKLGAR